MHTSNIHGQGISARSLNAGFLAALRRDFNLTKGAETSEHQQPGAAVLQEKVIVHSEEDNSIKLSTDTFMRP